MLENYHEPEELLSDESFLDWYFKTSPGDKAGQGKKWELWIAAGPGRRELVQEAIKLLDTTLIPEKALPAGQLLAAEKALMSRIPPVIQDTPVIRRTRVWAAAAVILLLIVSGWLVSRVLYSARPQLRTEYGQISNRQLPDGTEVVVNANSKLSYSAGWRDGVDREVWLNGEAFFHVRKTPMKSRFIVHTDHFDVIVTGTQFNVVNRNGLDNVMLKEGSVIVHTDGGAELKMIPGDYVEFNSDQLEKKIVKNDSLLAWREHKLMLDRTPLPELVRIIKDQYGVTVRLADDPVRNKTVSGVLLNNNLEVLLKALEFTSDFDVIRQDGEIIIRSHVQQ